MLRRDTALYGRDIARIQGEFVQSECESRTKVRGEGAPVGEPPEFIALDGFRCTVTREQYQRDHA